MAAKAKKLCDWKSKDITKKLDKFSDIVRNPQFVCTKCGRVADKKKWLHKPAALKQVPNWAMPNLVLFVISYWLLDEDQQKLGRQPFD